MRPTSEFLEQLVFKGYAVREAAVSGVKWRLVTLNREEYEEAFALASTEDNDTAKSIRAQYEVLARSLQAVNDVPCSLEKATEVLRDLPPETVDELYGQFSELEAEQQEAVRQMEALNELVDDDFSRIRYKVMRAAGALPTEDRVRRMNDVQYMWYYLNLLEDMKDLEKDHKRKLDYLAWFVNPELSERVSKYEKEAEGKPQASQGFTRVVGDTEYIQGSTTVNTEFEEELAKAMGDSPEMTELPGDTYKGNADESAEDFLKRVMSVRDQVNRARRPEPDPEDDPDLDIIEVGE